MYLWGAIIKKVNELELRERNENKEGHDGDWKSELIASLIKAQI